MEPNTEKNQQAEAQETAQETAKTAEATAAEETTAVSYTHLTLPTNSRV